MNFKEEIKAVLFDLDDTLINSKKAEYNAICEFKTIYAELNEFENNDFAKLWNKVTLETYEKYLNGDITFEELRILRMKRLFNNYHIDISYEDATEKFSIYQNLYEKNWILFDDAIEVLEYLNNKYRLVIVSNGDGKQQRRKIAYTGLNKFFSDIVISSEVGYSKPEKEIFEIACKITGLQPQNCIMIGDKYKVDIEGSLNAGIQGIWVNRKKEQLNYEYQIEELKELTKYF